MGRSSGTCALAYVSFKLFASVQLYYNEDGIRIYHGDCREYSGPPADCVIADPPYGETALGWDVRVKGWPASIADFSAAGSSLWVFGSLRFFMESAREFEGWRFAQDIVWEKHNGSGFHADRFKRVHEHALQFYRGEWAAVYKNPITTPDATARTVRRKYKTPHLNGNGKASSASAYRSEDGGPRLMRSVVYVPSCHGTAEHPTQKPLGIIDPLLRYSCRPGGVVLDPFMGSGSTLVAAKALGLGAVGIEIDERCCEIAARRLSQGVLALV